MIVLHSGDAQAVVVPDLGAGLASLAAGERPVLRPWSGDRGDGPFALACNLLLPFSNRISGGGFMQGGRQYRVPPNLPGEALPIHGDGFQREWTVTDQNSDSATFILSRGAIGPFRYRAEVRYDLQPDRLHIQLAMTNTAEVALPCGLGFHPWFPRDAATRLQFFATGMWPEAPDHLPATLHPVPLDGSDWQSGAPLPEGWINTAFSGWTGEADIRQGSRFASVRVKGEGLATALVYSPSSHADFFCFEPVSHPVDAHNLPGQPGLVVLASGQSLTAGMTMTWGEAA